MKRRIRKVANFFAFNLLFFALYLNFIHKDKSSLPTITDQTVQTQTAAFSGSVLVENPEKYLKQKKNESTVAIQEPSSKTEENDETALKLTIN